MSKNPIDQGTKAGSVPGQNNSKNPSSQSQVQAQTQNQAVLVTGASGFIGKPLTKALAAKGHTVVAMYRNNIPEPTHNVYPVCSDLSNVDLLAVPLRGVETVIHLAWENTYLGSEPKSSGDDRERNESLAMANPGSYGPSAYRGQNGSASHGHSSLTLSSGMTASPLSPNLAALQNLITAIEESKAQRLIFVSAMGCHRKSEHSFLREKFMAEGLVINSRIKEKVVLRTSLVYGGDSSKRDPFVGSLKELLSYPAFYPVPYPKLNLQPTHIDDLVDYVANLIAEKPETGNSLVEFCGKEGITTEDLVKLLAQRDAPKGKVPIKGPIGLSLLYVLEKSSSQKLSAPSIRQYLSAEAESQKLENSGTGNADSRYQKITSKRSRSLKESFGSYG